MVFTSIGFLTLFLPLFLASYYLTPAKWRNHQIVVWTLAFYAIDAGIFTGFFLLSLLINFAGGALIGRSAGRARGVWLAVTITINLGLLGWFKYATFFVDSINAVSGWWQGPRLPALQVMLPIGISFFTFQGIAYAFDIHRRVHEPARTFTEFAVFTACFPHLIAGPIVRFQDIAAAIRERRATTDDFFHGFVRLAWGLFRKLVFADTLGAIADRCFNAGGDALPPSIAWLGLACYTLQIYHDFAGYSDMAIGMGRMMGFTFPENFDQPYRARSITEFWRRWHMSLSRWFRDYVYIPLGGNRRGGTRTYLNLFVVFFLCGLWHGAAWTFVLWGIFHGLLLAGERMVLDRFGRQPRGVAGWVYAVTGVMIGWILFRADSAQGAWRYFVALWPGAPAAALVPIIPPLAADQLVALVAGAATALVPVGWVTLPGGSSRKLLAALLATAGYVHALAVLTANGFNPFIYFRF